MEINEILTFTEPERSLIRSLLNKGREAQKKQKNFSIINFESFYKLFTNEEVVILKKYLAINVAVLNSKLPFLGLEKIPTDLVPISGQQYIIDGQTHIITCQYLPKQTFEAYQQMNQTIYGEIGKKLLVLYGYRSPAMQVFMFFDILEQVYNFDLGKTVKRVCSPAYSEHLYPKKQAVDYATEDGVGIVTEGFETTQEYRWLKNNAGKFNFFESYPKDNNLDMMYEPWHWHHEEKG